MAGKHFGYAQSLKTWDKMLNCEMITFKAGIEWGCQLIMTAHIATPNVTDSDIPATMSSVILQGKQQGELGYQNVIGTDAADNALKLKFAKMFLCLLERNSSSHRLR